MGLLKNHYTVFTLDEDVLKVEAGLATRLISSTVLTVMQKDQINYLAGWGVEIFVIDKSEKITQIFILLNHLAVVYPQLQILLPH